MTISKFISFSGNFLTNNNKKLNIEEFKDSFNLPEVSETIGNVVHKYSIIFEGSYLKINFSDGAKFPRNPNVIDFETRQIEPNPKTANQIELKEYFAILDFDTCLLWVSNCKKRTVIIDFIKRKLKSCSIVVKDVFDKDKFVENIKFLDNLRMSNVPSLFSASHTLSKALSDEINQFGAVEAVLELKYHDKWIGDGLARKIKSIFDNKDNFGGLMVSGRDAKGYGLLFNLDTVSRKIEFKSSVDENGMFDIDTVFNNLICKIEDEKR